MLKFLATENTHRICAHCTRIVRVGSYFYTEGICGERYCSQSCYKGTRKVSAPKLRTTRDRAREAARLLLGAGPGYCMPRAFDDCFEMNDGSAVVIELRRMATNSDALKVQMEKLGYGYWLAPDYIKDPQPTLF